MAVKRAFLVTTAKNEAPYFLEWVAHHLEVGFTDIVVFQNDSDDLTHETLATLRKIGAITYLYNRTDAKQRRNKAYERSATLEGYQQSDWAMTLDMDEFLVIKAGNGTLADLVLAVPEADCLHLNTRMFGNSGYETLTDQLVTERFAMADHQLGKDDRFGAYKCLFRPQLFQRPGLPDPVALSHPAEHIRYSNGSGLRAGEYLVDEGVSTDPECCTFAQINHYAVRDLCSFMLKATQRPARRKWGARNTNLEIDDAMQPWLARVKARMEALDQASEGRLMDLREAAICDHLARYYTLLQNPKMRAFRKACKGSPSPLEHRKLLADPTPPAAKKKAAAKSLAKPVRKRTSKTATKPAKAPAPKPRAKAAT